MCIRAKWIMKVLFLAAVFGIAKDAEWLKYPSREDWLNKSQHTERNYIQLWRRTQRSLWKIAKIHSLEANTNWRIVKNSIVPILSKWKEGKTYAHAHIYMCACICIKFSFKNIKLTITTVRRIDVKIKVKWEPSFSLPAS